VLGIIGGLAARGVSTLLILFHEGELAAQARALGIDPVILPNRNVALLATSRRLARILERCRIRVVHVHGYKATVFCALARRWHCFAMVKTEHGLPEPTAGGAARGWRNRFYYWVDSAATRIGRAAVCYVTEDLRKYYARAHAGLSAIVIPNGVRAMERDQFPRPSEMRDEWFNLLLVGRLDSVKGHHLAIEAMAAEGIAPDVHLHILGVGPRESELLDLAGSLRIASRVHMLGFRRNAYDYIAHCKVLLMPSLHEGLPYTLLEAMALGIPAVASRVGGLAEVIQDDATGILVPPRDVPALSAAIRRLHRDDALRVRLGEAARQLQRAQYSLEAMTGRYIQIYWDLQHPCNY
jgi:glycosyltransferase involved in cell wall biosynthesis